MVKGSPNSSNGNLRHWIDLLYSFPVLYSMCFHHIHISTHANWTNVGASLAFHSDTTRMTTWKSGFRNKWEMRWPSTLSRNGHDERNIAWSFTCPYILFSLCVVMAAEFERMTAASGLQLCARTELMDALTTKETTMSSCPNPLQAPLAAVTR